MHRKVPTTVSAVNRAAVERAFYDHALAINHKSLQDATRAALPDPTMHAWELWAVTDENIFVFSDGVSWLDVTLGGPYQPLDADLTDIAGLTPTTNNFIVSVASHWASVTPAAVLAILAAVGTTFQPLDSDLTAIAALAPTNDDVIQRKAGAWTNRTMAQLAADLGVSGGPFQPLDSDLTAIAGLTATTDNIIQSVASAWASRTPAQVLATMAAIDHATTVQQTMTVTSAGAAATQLVLRNADNTANTAATLQLNPSTSAARFAEIAAIQLGANVIDIVLRPSNSGVMHDALRLFSTGGVAVGTAIDKGINTFNAGTIYQGGSTLASLYQPLDSDLTTIAGLTATTDNFIVSVASAWASRTPAQVLATLAAVGTTFQPLDQDLTDIAGITRARGDLIRGDASAWGKFSAKTADTFVGGDGTDVVARTAAQVKTSLGFVTSSTDNNVPRFDSTAGNMQSSKVFIEDTITLADDTAINLGNIAGGNAELVFIGCHTKAAPAYTGILRHRTGDPSIDNLVALSLTNVTLDASGTALAGTTGTDGNITIRSVSGASAGLHIENRSAASRTFTVFRLGIN